MTDAEMTKLCAEAMGMDWAAEQKRMADRDGKWLSGYETPRYDPLVNDAQAMALVKKLRIAIWDGEDGVWFTSIEGEYFNADGGPPKEWEVRGSGKDLNRAIVKCVAQMNTASTCTKVK